MVAETYNQNIDHGLAPGEAAKLEIGASLAALGSGPNLAFWLLYQIFTNTAALEAIQNELCQSSGEDLECGVPTRRILKLNKVRSNCPTLVAMMNETLRYHSATISVKEIQRDTVLADKYLLKKDAIAMIPGQSVHHSKDIWGPDAGTFDYRRLMSSQGKKNLASTSAFRPFGAGANMCPGGNFSMNVDLSLVVMAVLQYDVLPVGEKWVAPTKRRADLWKAMPKPDWDIDVEFVRRVDGEDVEWKFGWAE